MGDYSAFVLRTSPEMVAEVVSALEGGNGRDVVGHQPLGLVTGVIKEYAPELCVIPLIELLQSGKIDAYALLHEASDASHRRIETSDDI